jgi:hypothetical protein
MDLLTKALAGGQIRDRADGENCQAAALKNEQIPNLLCPTAAYH